MEKLETVELRNTKLESLEFLKEINTEKWKYFCCNLNNVISVRPLVSVNFRSLKSLDYSVNLVTES